jgi:hypothetical protein
MSSNDMVSALCAMISKANADIMAGAVERAGRSGVTELPDGGWRILEYFPGGFVVQSRDTGERFRIQVTAMRGT